jgi:hypothetical protein
MPTRLAALVVLAALIAACGGSAASSSPSPGPTATPAQTLTASPTPTATVPSSTDAGETGGPYAEALVAALADENLTTHIVQAASVTTSAAAGVEVLADLEGDVAGQDLSLVIRVSSAGVESVQELRVVGDTAYVRQEDGPWQSAPRAVVADSLTGLLDNLRVVDRPEDLRYVGLEDLDGRQLHHLVGAGAVPYSPSTGGTGQFTALDVWVEEDGTPVLIRGDFSAVDAAGIEGAGSTEFRFSNFGGPIEIVAPELAP